MELGYGNVGRWNRGRANRVILDGSGKPLLYSYEFDSKKEGGGGGEHWTLEGSRGRRNAAKMKNWP